MKYQQWTINEHRNVKLEGYIWNPVPLPPNTAPGTLPWYPQQRPTVLICPGGGYFHVSLREAEPVAMKFYAAGYNAFVLTYSIGDDSAYPHPWVDASRAMRFIRAHAEDFSTDIEQVTIVGFSAGGHLAAWLSTSFANAELLGYEKEEVSASSFYDGELDALGEVTNRPDACVVGYPVVDIRNEALKESPDVTPEKLIAALGYLPGALVIGQNENASPLPFVSDTNPPTFIWTTATDAIVPAQQSLNFANALVASGVRCEFHMFPEGEHGLSTADHLSCSDCRPVPVRIRSWFPMACQFLNEIFDVEL